jgi:hypothetical protein
MQIQRGFGVAFAFLCVALVRLAIGLFKEDRTRAALRPARVTRTETEGNRLIKAVLCSALVLDQAQTEAVSAAAVPDRLPSTQTRLGRFKAYFGGLRYGLRLFQV